MMNDTFMKEKPVLPLILSMSLPMVLSMLVNSLYNIVDSFFVAQISEEAMTALSLVYPVQNFINAVGIGFGVGINAVIALYLGAGDNKKADQAATQGLVLAMIHGVVMTVCCITMMPVFLGMFTSSKTVIELGVRYSVIAFAFTLIIIVGVTFEKLFQAVGNMKTTMISLMCGCITNIVLDPALILGYGPFPEMGIEGAALATGIGQALTLAIYLVVYFVRPIRVHIRRQYILLSKKMVIKLYSIGIPATLNLALPSLLISALNAILAAYSEVYILVLGIYYKLQTFIYLPANGIVQGMRPLIGYNYGAGENKRVSQIYKIVLCMSGIIMVLGTVICLLIPGQLMGLFDPHRSDNPERGNSPAYHRRRFYRLGGFRYIFRRTGGTWKRHSFITDFTLPVCCGYHPNCVFTQQAFRSGWRLECVLDHGSDYCDHFYLCLLQGNSTKPAEPVNSKMNVALRRR